MSPFLKQIVKTRKCKSLYTALFSVEGLHLEKWLLSVFIVTKLEKLGR